MIGQICLDGSAAKLTVEAMIVSPLGLSGHLTAGPFSASLQATLQCRKMRDKRGYL